MRDPVKSRGLVRSGDRNERERFVFVRSHQARYPVVTLCRLLGVSPSGYYAWRKRGPSARVIANAFLSERIATIVQRAGVVHGRRRIKAALNAEGVRVGNERLGRVLRAQKTALNRRVGAPLADMFATPYYVKDAGTFSRIGCAVEITTIPRTSAVIAALAGGAIDLGLADPVAAVQAIHRGAPIQLLATCGLYVSSKPIAMVAVAQSSPIHHPRDLEGKTLATPQVSGLSAASTHAWLAANGVDIAKVRIVQMSMPAQTEAIARGTLDAGLMSEPFYSAAKGDLRILARPLDAIGGSFVLSAWFATRSWIEADRGRARAVVEAVYETARWANAHRAETLAILARDGKMSLKRIRGMARVPYATALDVGQLQPLLNAARTYKLIDRSVDAGSILARL